MSCEFYSLEFLVLQAGYYDCQWPLIVICAAIADENNL